MHLFYRNFGSGSPYVILHGLYGSSDNWYSFGKALSDNYEIFLVDHRNHGNSFHSDEFNFKAMCEDLNLLFSEKKIKKAILMGHSMGGKTALFFASKYPKLIKALIVIDVSPNDYNKENKEIILNHKKIITALDSLPIHHFTKREEADTELSKTITSYRIRQFLLKNLKRNKEGGFYWGFNLSAIRDNLEKLNSGLKPEDFTNVHYPVLFIKGELSAYINENDKKCITKCFPNADIIEVKNTGHWVHSEEPDLVKEIILNFLSKYTF